MLVYLASTGSGGTCNATNLTPIGPRLRALWIVLFSRRVWACNLRPATLRPEITVDRALLLASRVPLQVRRAMLPERRLRECFTVVVSLYSYIL